MKHSYSIKQEMTAKFCNALANPARIAICQLLGKHKFLFFGRLHGELPLSKATVSQHLSVLKEAGLIDAEVMTPHVRYSINEENWKLAKLILFNFMDGCVSGESKINALAEEECEVDAEPKEE